MLRAFSFVYMLPPLPRRSDWVPLLLNPPDVSTFPERVTGSVCASTFSRLAQRSLTLRPAHSRCHQFVTCISRRLQPFRYLHSCSGSFRLEHLPGGTCTHWKTPPFHGAHPMLPVTTGSSRVFKLLKKEDADRSMVLQPDSHFFGSSPPAHAMNCQWPPSLISTSV